MLPSRPASCLVDEQLPLPLAGGDERDEQSRAGPGACAAVGRLQLESNRIESLISHSLTTASSRSPLLGCCLLKDTPVMEWGDPILMECSSRVGKVRESARP
uniref:Uncharacterized protein n=1 Tax=Arundo donax TaxID=35708 RepID=A0A0A9EVX2_ARUDO